jgi:hypothetical protein
MFDNFDACAEEEGVTQLGLPESNRHGFRAKGLCCG